MVLDVQRDLRYSSRRPSSDQILVEFPQAKLDPAKCTVNINDGLVKGAKGEQIGKSAKIIIQLQQPNLKYAIFSLRRPPRLVIDVSRARAGAKGGTAVEEKGLKIKTIIIDPGHGGKDPGAVGRRGLKEKDVTLDIARRLKRNLDRDGRLKVYLTRTRDQFLPLRKRSSFANQKKGDLFISIHANAAYSRRISGFETFYLCEAVDDTARAVAARENSVLRLESSKNPQSMGSDLEVILWELKYTEFRTQSRELAQLVQKNLDRRFKMRNRGVKTAPFYVLRKVDMPSVLVEVGFISNLGDEAMLASKSHREKMAQALAESIISYRRKYEREKGFTR